MAAQAGGAFNVYVGTYTKGQGAGRPQSEGIYVYRMDATTGALTHAHTTPGVVNPSFLTLAPSRRFLYAVNEVQDAEGKSGGGVSAFAVDAATGVLTYLNQQSTNGADPCHVSVDHAGAYLLVANYGSGSVAMFPTQADGRLGSASDFVQHQGSSVNPRRQQGPHAHSITPDPGNRYALAADLGLDKVLVYRLDATPGKLIPNSPPSASVAPGAGPRHLAFHPNGRLVYLINEIGSTVTVFGYDAGSGGLRELQTLSTLPADFTGTSHCADIHVAPNGRYVYGSNRGHDSLAIFAVDSTTGALTAVGHAPTGGRTPRNFAIDPTGAFVLAANQNSDTIVTFRINQETGALTPTGAVAQVPSPVCIQFAPLAG